MGENHPWVQGAHVLGQGQHQSAALQHLTSIPSTLLATQCIMLGIISCSFPQQLPGSCVSHLASDDAHGAVLPEQLPHPPSCINNNSQQGVDGVDNGVDNG
jgi:hypothetical protein